MVHFSSAEFGCRIQPDIVTKFQVFTKTVSREDSQVDFATETFFALGGGGGGGGSQERFSNLGNNQFFKRRNLRKTLVSMEEFYTVT